MMKKKSDELIQCISHGFKMYFFTTDKVTKTLIKKGKNSLYKKDIVFVSIYNGLENKNILPEKILLMLHLLKKKRKHHTCSSRFHGPFEALQVDIAYISFLAR